MAETPFDPTPYIQQVERNGRSVPWLPVHWRLVWLRAVHPRARIETDLAHVGPELIIVRATIALTDGTVGAALGDDRGPAARVELAEERALDRALTALGFAVDYSMALAETASPVSAGPAVAKGPVLPAGVTVGPEGRSTLPPRLAAAFANAQPIVGDPDEQSSLPAPAPVAEPAAPPPSALAGESAPAPARVIAERPAPMADVERDESAAERLADQDWSHFWVWARAQGFTSRAEVERVVGESIKGRTPREVRLLLQRFNRLGNQ